MSRSDELGRMLRAGTPATPASRWSGGGGSLGTERRAVLPVYKSRMVSFEEVLDDISRLTQGAYRRGPHSEISLSAVVGLTFTVVFTGLPGDNPACIDDAQRNHRRYWPGTVLMVSETCADFQASPASHTIPSPSSIPVLSRLATDVMRKKR